MFTRRKKSYGVIIGASIVITLCILIVVIAWPTESGSTQDPNTQYSSGDNVSKPDDGNQTNIHDEPSGNNISSKGNQSQEGNEQPNTSGQGDTPTPFSDENSQQSGISIATDSYYLVKYVDGSVKVLFFDANGNSIELEKTAIAYDVLNPSDQKLLSNGIKASTQEELATILQDFEG